MSEHMSDFVIFMAKVRQFRIEFERVRAVRYSDSTLVGILNCHGELTWAFYFDSETGEMIEQMEFNESGDIVRYA